jgi:hypothetical protein
MRIAMTFRRAFLAISLFTAGAFGVGVLVNALLDQASASLARPEAAASEPEREVARPAEVRAVAAPAPAAVADAAYVNALFGPSMLQQATPAPSATTAAAYAPSAEPRPSLRGSAETPARSAPVIRVEDVDRPDKLLTQIARMKTTLNLTAEQEAYWRPVEAELRRIAQQQQLQKRAGKAGTAKIAIDPAAAQRLYWAAFPLILSLSAEQKQIVRHAARSMGFEQVASAL